MASSRRVASATFSRWATEQRYDIYDLFLTFPDPLVSRELRLEVAERIDRDGKVVTALDAEAVRTAARELAAAGCEAIAVCFLNSYRDAAHEQEAGRIVRETCPDIAVSLSSEVVAEIWEYQRFVTTAANAYVQPLMRPLPPATGARTRAPAAFAARCG